MGCGIYWQQINTIEKAMKGLRVSGIPEISDAYQSLNQLRGQLLTKVGLKFPRTVSQIARFAGLSPGEIRVWFDIESGWMAEARAKPGAPPVYHALSAETAAQILKGELTKELELQLMAPDEYLGE